MYIAISILYEIYVKYTHICTYIYILYMCGALLGNEENLGLYRYVIGKEVFE